MKPMEYRFRPKGEYVMQAPMQEIYLLAEHYKKELSFLIEEILFFEKLIATYNPSANVNLAKMDQLVKNASILLRNILAQIEEHLKHIDEVIQKTGDGEVEAVVREEQLLMEDTLTTFADSFRTLKTALYTEVGRHIQQFVPGKN
jgi:hypothetical protein